MIDTALKPWLLEVNASPSLSTTTPTDKALKTALIGEVLDLVLPPSFFEPSAPSRPSTASGASSSAASRRRSAIDAAAAAEAAATSAHEARGSGANGGAFEMLYDEATELESERAKREAAGEGRAGGRGGSRWQAAQGRFTAASAFR